MSDYLDIKRGTASPQEFNRDFIGSIGRGHLSSFLDDFQSQASIGKNSASFLKLFSPDNGQTSYVHYLYNREECF